MQYALFTFLGLGLLAVSAAEGQKKLSQGHPLRQHLHRGQQGLSRWDACYPSGYSTYAS